VIRQIRQSFPFQSFLLHGISTGLSCSLGAGLGFVAFGHAKVIEISSLPFFLL